MEQRTVQVGDIAQIAVQSQNYVFPIEKIDDQGIHASSYLIVPQGSIWQVQGYTIPHTISFHLAPQLTTEPPVYAIYPRTGPRKILMLLKPRSREVVYTPLGIEFLGLNKERLPSYEIATNIVARGGSQAVSLPYIKGRSEEEVERLILEQKPQPEYQIRDIVLGDIYTGLYGQVEPVGKALKPVIPCQKRQHFVLTQSPRGSIQYDLFINPEDSSSFKQGLIMMGKNNDYIITSTMGFQEIIEDLKRCGRVYYLIGVSKDKIGFTLEFEETSHAMAILIDPQSELLEVFDPNGINPDTRHVYFWSTQLVELLRKNGIQVQRRITADEPFCPQGVSAFARGFRREQQCLVWSYWYIWLRINNPEVPGEAIRNYMARMTPDEAFDRIRRIAKIAFGA